MNKYYKEMMIWKQDNECLKEIKARGEKTVDLPIWIINNYIKSTCDNYTKLLYLLKILDIYSDENSSIVDIGVSTKSVPIDKDGVDFEDKLIDKILNKKKDGTGVQYCLISQELKDGEKGFWHYFSNCERPICFALTDNNEVMFLHNPRGNEGIKVCDISYHSPIDIGFGGIGDCIEHLITAGCSVRNDERMQEEHEARMLTQAMRTIGEGINVQEKLANSNLPESQKIYLQNMYNAIMAKQEKMNEQIGISMQGIDVRM